MGERDILGGEGARPNTCTLHTFSADLKSNSVAKKSYLKDTKILKRELIRFTSKNISGYETITFVLCCFPEAP